MVARTGDAPARVRKPIALEYMVATVGEIDAAVYALLEREGAARAVEGKPGSYEILDIAAARSQTVLPKILDEFGRDGWKLIAVNRAECWIFERPSARRSRRHWQYLVASPADIDAVALRTLEEEGALRRGADGDNAVEITDMDKARIQVMLPRILDSMAAEGWALSAISGPQLHFFVREAAA